MSQFNAKPLPKPLKATVTIILFCLGSFMLLKFLSGQPEGLGLTNGRLSECPETPNCVCSQSECATHSIPPISFSGSTDHAWQRIRQAILSQPRTTVLVDDGSYLHAEVKSAIFRFVDDVEVHIDEDQHIIHIRSTSRVGFSDLGVNRKRVEAIRAAFDKLALEE